MAALGRLPICGHMLFSIPAVINHNSQRHFCERDRAVAEDEELTDIDVLHWGDRWFESISLQRGVNCEPDFLTRGAMKPKTNYCG